MRNNSKRELNPCEFKYTFKKTRNFFGITRRQLDVLLTPKKIVDNKVVLRNKIVSKGAYYRLKDQAVTNIIKSIMLVSLLVSCDVIYHDDMISLITITSNLLNEDVPVEDIFKRLKGFLKNKLYK